MTMLIRDHYLHPEAIKVILNEAGIKEATIVGGERQHNARTYHLSHKYGRIRSPEDWWMDVNSTGGEMAGCGEYQLDWARFIPGPDLSDRNGLKPADGTHPVSGREVDFRTVQESHLRLIVRPDDFDDRAYFLVVGILPRYWLQGWLLGREAKRTAEPQGLGGREPACFIEARYLHSAPSFHEWLWSVPA